MKKAYIIPQSKFICLDPEESMAFVTSSNQEDGLDGTSFGGGTGTNGVVGGDSKRRIIWDDEF